MLKVMPDLKTILRQRREEKAGDIYTMARRLARDESIDADEILAALDAAGATDDDLHDAVDLVIRRDELRRIAAQGPAARQELAAVRSAIQKHRAELDAAEERYRRAVEPLARQEQAAQAIDSAATQAEAGLLSPANLPKVIRDRVEAARGEFHAAAVAVSELEDRLRTQERRAADARERLDAEHGGADAALALYETERRPFMPADRVELVEHIRGGLHQSQKLREEVRVAVRVREQKEAAFKAEEKAAHDF